MYVRRNLQRGYTRKDLNISFLREKRMNFKSKVDEVKTQTKEFIDRQTVIIWCTIFFHILVRFICLFISVIPENKQMNRTIRPFIDVSPTAAKESLVRTFRLISTLKSCLILIFRKTRDYFQSTFGRAVFQVIEVKGWILRFLSWFFLRDCS